MKNPNEKENRKSISQVEFDLFIFLLGLTVSSIVLLADFYKRFGIVNKVVLVK